MPSISCSKEFIIHLTAYMFCSKQNMQRQDASEREVFLVGRPKFIFYGCLRKKECTEIINNKVVSTLCCCTE